MSEVGSEPAAASGHPERRYLVAAVILLVLGMLLLGRAAVTLLRGPEAAFVDGQATAVADTGETWWVATPASAQLGGVSCTASISGQGVPLSRAESGRTVSVDGQDWRALFVVTAERPGDLVVRCTTVETSDLALVGDQRSATGGWAVLVPGLLGLALLGAAAGGTWWLIAGRSRGSAEEGLGVEPDSLGEPEEPTEP